MQLTRDAVINTLNLALHGTCGYMGESFVSKLRVPAEALPTAFGGSRDLGGVLYFLVAPDASVKLHRIRSDQMYHHYFGEPLEVLLLNADGAHKVHVVGPDLAAGMRPQLLVPGNTFHAGLVRKDYALLGTSVWAKAEPQDVEIADAAKLIAAYPAAKETIAVFTATGRGIE